MKTKKERTAMSILVGLNQKFARNKDQTYSAQELHTLFSELIGQVKKGEIELDFIEKIDPARPKDKIWGVVDDAIERSKIKRYDWNKVFGRSLTQKILIYKRHGCDVEETFMSLSNDPRVLNFIEDNPKEKKKILENLKISIHARFGENNTAKKIMEEDQ